MELNINCIYCGVNRFVSITDYCYTDVTADLLSTPSSPNDIARMHEWFEAKDYRDWYGMGE